MADTDQTKSDKNYALEAGTPENRIEAPDLPYRPRNPRTYRPKIGLIGCGGITQTHLKAYVGAGYEVVMMCDHAEAAAKARRDAFYPDAAICTDYREVLRRDDIDVIDLAPHPEDRVPLLEAAIDAGKHVLSQKPFVLDLDFGQRVVEQAKVKGVKVAVNQNGRWAPHFSYLRHAVAAGLIGQVQSVDCAVHWNHNWVVGSPFDRIRHLVFYDFAIHWFDILACFMRGREAKRVVASMCRSASQQAQPPLLAHALIDYDDAQASLVFRADTPYGEQDRTVIVGSQGTLVSEGPSLGDQTVTLYTKDGRATPKLEGSWFPDGFHGTMGELLCAIEEDREPTNSAANNLRSLEVCFAAIAAAERGEPVRPGDVRKLDPTWVRP